MKTISIQMVDNGYIVRDEVVNPSDRRVWVFKSVEELSCWISSEFNVAPLAIEEKGKEDPIEREFKKRGEL